MFGGMDTQYFSKENYKTNLCMQKQDKTVFISQNFPLWAG